MKEINPPDYRNDTVLPLPPEVKADAWAVDAACSGNPGPMEYQAIDLQTGYRVFHYGVRTISGSSWPSSMRWRSVGRGDYTRRPFTQTPITPSCGCRSGSARPSWSGHHRPNSSTRLLSGRSGGCRPTTFAIPLLNGKRGNGAKCLRTLAGNKESLNDVRINADGVIVILPAVNHLNIRRYQWCPRTVADGQG